MQNSQCKIVFSLRKSDKFSIVLTLRYLRFTIFFVSLQVGNIHLKNMEYLYLLLCLAVIIFSADWLVDGAVVIAKRYKISDFVIGAVIVGVGTSFPELVASSIGALEGESDIAIGNVIGSNIFNVLGILGLTVLIMPVAVSKENKRFDLPFCIAISLLTMLLVFNFFAGGDPTLSRIDGLVLLATFGLFMFLSLRGGKSNSAVESSEVITNKKLLIGIAKLFVGLVALIFASNFFLDNAIKIATNLGVKNSFIAITLVACGTSLPELAASLAAAAKKNTQMALGNIIGSNIFNLSLILGAASQITPLTSSDIGYIDYGVMIFASVAPLALAFRGKLNRWAGAILFICFIAYNYYLIANANL